jgi:hypothetical protein
VVLPVARTAGRDVGISECAERFVDGRQVRGETIVASSQGAIDQAPDVLI